MHPFDIQRKWLLAMLAANQKDAMPSAIINHGTLLSPDGRKLSRYSGASIADVPTDVEPCVIRAALLSAPLGKDLHATKIPTADASRLREKVFNSLRFVANQELGGSGGVDLDAELDVALSEVELHMRDLNIARAYSSFRRAIVHHVSALQIPRIRRHGLATRAVACNRIASLHRIFYADDPRLDQLPPQTFDAKPTEP